MATYFVIKPETKNRRLEMNFSSFFPEPAAQSHNKLKSNIDKLFSLYNEKRNVYNIVFVRLFLDMFVTEYRVHFVCVYPLLQAISICSFIFIFSPRTLLCE